jgi:hypothetical protein
MVHHVGDLSRQVVQLGLASDLADLLVDLFLLTLQNLHILVFEVALLI